MAGRETMKAGKLVDKHNIRSRNTRLWMLVSQREELGD